MTSKARLRWALDRHLDRIEAAGRLVRLLDASGKSNPAHGVAYFRAQWFHTRFLDRLMSWSRAREKEKSARYYLRDAFGREIADD
jgi:hypothetical protein